VVTVGVFTAGVQTRVGVDVGEKVTVEAVGVGVRDAVTVNWTEGAIETVGVGVKVRLWVGV
jgi:hypothetical protein